MKFVSPLTEEEQIALTQVYQAGKSPRQRQRAHAVLLSAQGYSITQLAELFAVDRDTVSRGFDAWQQTRIAGLADAPKSGRPRKVTQEIEAVLLDLLENPTPALKALVAQELQKKHCGLMGHAKAYPPSSRIFVSAGKTQTAQAAFCLSSPPSGALLTS